MKNSTAYSLAALSFAAALAGCGVNDVQNSRTLASEGIKSAPLRATAVCTDYSGKIIFNAAIDAEDLDWNDLEGQVVGLPMPDGSKAVIKGACTVTQKYYAASEQNRIDEYRRTQPVVATLTNGIDSIQLSERFSKANDVGRNSSSYDGWVQLILKSRTGAVLEEVDTNAANVIAVRATIEPAFSVEPN